jgi:hypothetical protein
MFKFLRNLVSALDRAGHSVGRTLSLGAVVLGGICSSGCHTLPPFPAVDLHQPGWSAREAQAIWRRTTQSPELVGELLVATGPGGQSFVQFTKNPFPLMVAQRTDRGWELLVPARNQRFSARGEPPGRIILFHLPRLLAGEPPPQGWSWEVLEGGGWRLGNKRSGEMLEGYWLR